MHSVRSKSLGYVLAIAIGIAPAALPSQAIAEADDHSEQASAELMFFDGLFVRPIMLAGTVLGTATFLITLPFTIPAGGVPQAHQKFIVEPAGYTFTRPFGEFGPHE
jgi:hypothetical protein